VAAKARRTAWRAVGTCIRTSKASPSASNRSWLSAVITRPFQKHLVAPAISPRTIRLLVPSVERLIPPLQERFPARLLGVGDPLASGFPAELRDAVPDPFDRYFYPGFPASLRRGPDLFRGKRVRIPKGTLIHSMHPKDPQERFPLGRAITITVFSSSAGYVFDPYKSPFLPSYRQAELTWPGTGGYWKSVQLRDAVLLDAIEGIAPVTPTETQTFDIWLVERFSPGRTL